MPIVCGIGWVMAARLRGLAVVQFILWGTRPIGRVDAMRHITVECGIRPIRHSSDRPILDWIAMAIVNVCRIVPTVSQGVLPKPTLPQIRRERIWTHSARRTAAMEWRLSNAAFALCDTNSRTSFGSRQGLDKANLDGFQRLEKSSSPGGSVHTH